MRVNDVAAIHACPWLGAAEEAAAAAREAEARALAESLARTTGLDFLVGGVSAGGRGNEDGYFA